ncbi:putative serine-threonine protein phosphatase [Leptomonas pyrrhocoris]|uniref:Serine/threonine-protein phosphatase n=1 Tax=Leptomonas pyrrhocoris TaxID=157538 RepID=A0A0M9FRC7_LEPPY|nr:putative serine-threonine protein phosphatase [Leptomonas pyrrhocoris]XP_015652746.1 putative serine-threonine protein phosphatase [Leptomonas pyrrhocoris]KPA74306.1 putative serine-threonine protein phosphatase [Leptomonas pyrrhocoris]KPA74307.1 putative serine-threonine protein phosphatase [Leptomonas pyrrhocoris]|eukprot:XP_015652745.1 putative serine-threonine protein phosphatase [Leptomonas pyrrhocoris]
MNALIQTEQAEEYIARFALRQLVEEWLSRVGGECPDDPYQYLIDEADDQRRSGGGIVTCPNKWCNMTMPASRFAAHQMTCNDSTSWVRCVRCNVRVDAAKLSQHRLYCKLERCAFCGEMVLPRMLALCPYRTIAKAEQDRQAALHRRERRVEKEAMRGGVPLIMSGPSTARGAGTRPPSTLPASAPSPPPAPQPSCSSYAPVIDSSAEPPSQVSLSAAETAAVEVASKDTEAQPIMKTPSTASASLLQKSVSGCVLSSRTEQDGVDGPSLSVTVAVPPGDDEPKRRGKNADATNSGTPDAVDNGSSESSVPRPSFPAFLAADMAVRETLKNYPDALVPALSTIQTIWRRNMTMHLFRQQVFSAVWQRMDSAQEGATGRSKDTAALRLVDHNLRTDRRLSSIDVGSGHGSSSHRRGSAAVVAATGVSSELSSSALSGPLKDSDFYADEEPIPSFQSDPVCVCSTPLNSGGFMRVPDLEALMRHCQGREVLQFSVVLKIVRAATKLLQRRPLVQHIAIPANSSLIIVGDVHGQMKDLEYIINSMGLPSAERFYLFNGDFVDRGVYGCEVLMLIYGLLCTYPDSVFLNRGNHENYSTNIEYGFMAELYAKYASRAAYLLDAMTDSYEVMPLMSVVDHRVAVMHGGAPRLVCKLSEIEAIGHVRDIPVEQQSTRSEQLLAELLWNDPVEKFRSRQLGMNHQGEGWRSSSRGCGVEYLSNITEQFLKNNDLKLLIRSHDVKTAGFDLVHKNKSITVFSASNYGGVSGNRGAVAVLTREAEQPVFHTWFLKEDYREHQQDGLLDGGIDACSQDDRNRGRAGGDGGSPLVGTTGASANRMGLGSADGLARTMGLLTANTAALAAPRELSMKTDGTSGSVVVAAGSGISPHNASNASALTGPTPPSQQRYLRRVNATTLAEAALMDGDEYICAYYLSSGGVLGDEDLMNDASNRSSAFSDSEERINAESTTAAAVVGDGATCTPAALGRAPPTKMNSTSVTGSSTQRWLTTTTGGGGGSANGGSMSSGCRTTSGSRGTQASIASYSSLSSQGALRPGCALAQDASIMIQLQTLQQIRELTYFQRYALLVAFNQVDEMHTGTVFKAEWCVVMRDVLNLDIPWYYLCQFLAPRLVVDGAPSVEYMRFLRHFDVCFAIDYRLSWQKSTVRRISGGLDLPEDVVNAFCERPAMNASSASSPNGNTTMTNSCGDANKERNASAMPKSAPDLLSTSPLTTSMLELPAATEAPTPSHGAPSETGSSGKPWKFASANAIGTAASTEQPTTEGEDWWCDVQLDFRTFAMKVRVLSPAAAAMEDNEIFALFCFFDVSMQGHVYVGDMVNSIIAVMDEGGGAEEPELLVSGELDFSMVAGGRRAESPPHAVPYHSLSCSSTISSSSSEAPRGGGGGNFALRAKRAAGGKPNGDGDGGGGGRSLLASKLKVIENRLRLIRPPSSSSDEPDSGRIGDGDDAESGSGSRGTSPVAPPSSGADDGTHSYLSAPQAARHDFLAKVDGGALVGASGEQIVDIISTTSPTAPGSRLGRIHVPHPSSSEETDASSSVTSTRPAASRRNSVMTDSALKRCRSVSDANTADTQTGSCDSGAAPPVLASTAFVANTQFSSPASQVLVLPLDYEEDETDPHDAGATVPPEPRVPRASTLADATAATVVDSTLGGEHTADSDAATSAAAAMAAATEESAPQSLVSRSRLKSNPITADDGTSTTESPEDVSNTTSTSRTSPTSRSSTAPLRRHHSFNESPTSVSSSSSVTGPAMGMSKPFDDYNAALFQLNSGNAAEGDGVGGIDLNTRATLPLTLEQRVNKRLSMPPWIYPTLMRVQEQLLGGYTRLRFLFQALNRSHNGRLTEAEFLPLMKFMNCLLEHPLSPAQGHQLFECMHDSAIHYVQSMRNRRRQRSGSLYSDLMDLSNVQGSPVGVPGERTKPTSAQDPSPADVLPDGNAYAQHRYLSEQVRGERYILFMEFLAFFGVKPVQHEDEVEALEELLFDATDANDAASAVGTPFGDLAREGSADGVGSERPLANADLAVDENAGSLSSVSVTISTGVPASAAAAAAAASAGGAASQADGTETRQPAAIRVKGHFTETPTALHVAEMPNTAGRPLSSDGVGYAATPPGQRRRNSSAAAPFLLSTVAEAAPSASVPRQSDLLDSDSPSIAVNSSSLGGNNPHLASWAAPSSGATLIPTVVANGKLSPHRRLSSAAVSGIGVPNGGDVVSAVNNVHNPTMPQASLRSASTVASAALSLDDVGDRHLHASVIPTPMDVLTALATLGDVYGADITVKELMQRLAAASQQSPPSRRTRAVLPQPQDHHTPIAFAASSLTSFASNSSEANHHHRQLNNNDGDAAPSPPPAKQKRVLHPRRTNSPPQRLQCNAQSESHGAGAAQMFSVGFTSPTSSFHAPSPITVSLDVPQHTHVALQSSLSGGDHNGARLNSHSNPGAEAEFSLVSLYTAPSQTSRLNSRNHTIVSSVMVPTPPPMHAVPHSRVAGQSSTSHSQRPDSYLELSLASISARPYMLNQTAEQRVTMPFNRSFGAQHPTHSTSPVLSFAASMSSAVMVGSDTCAGGAVVDHVGLPGSTTRHTSTTVAVVPVQGSRHHQRVPGIHAAKHGAAATVLMNASSTTSENELVAMSVVPFTGRAPGPPAPPTRQRGMPNNTTATLSDAQPASSSVTSDSRGAGADDGAPQKLLRPPSLLRKHRPAENTTEEEDGSPHRTVAEVPHQQHPHHRIRSDAAATPEKHPPPPPPPLSSSSLARPSRPTSVPQSQERDDTVSPAGHQKAGATPKAPTETEGSDEVERVLSKLEGGAAAAAAAVATTATVAPTHAQQDSRTTASDAARSGSHSPPCPASEASVAVSSFSSPTRAFPTHDGGSSSTEGGRLSTPAPPPLPLNQGDAHDHHAAASRSRPSRSTPVAKNASPLPLVPSGEAAAAEFPVSQMASAKNNDVSEAPETTTTTTTTQSSPKVHTGRPGSTGTSTVAPPPPSPVLPGGDGAASTAADALSSPAAPSSGGPPPQRDPHRLGTASDAAGEECRGESAADTQHPPSRRASKATKERHGSGNSNSSANAKKPSSVTERKASVKSAGTASVSSAHSRGSTSEATLLAVPPSTSPDSTPKNANTPTADDRRTSSGSSTTKKNGLPRSTKSNKPSTGSQGAPPKVKEEATAADDAMLEAAPMTAIPPSDKATPPSTAAAHGRRPRLPPPTRRLPLKSLVARAPALQHIGDSSPAAAAGAEGHGDGAHVNGAAGKAGQPKGTNSPSAATAKTNCHGSSSKGTANTATAVTADAAQLPSAAPEKSLTAPARPPPPERRDSATDSNDCASSVLASAALTPCPPLQSAMARSTPPAVILEMPKGSEMSPLAKFAAATRGVRGGKKRRNQQSSGSSVTSGSGGNRSRRDSGEDSQRCKSTQKEGWAEPATGATVSFSPPTLSIAHIVAVPQLTAHHNLPGGGGDGLGGGSCSSHPSILEPLPAIEKAASTGSNSGVSSPESLYVPRDTEPHPAQAKPSPLYPLQPKLPASNNASLSRDSNGVSAASMTDRIKMVAGANAESVLGASTKRSAVQGLKSGKASAEAPRLVTGGSHYPALPPHNNGPILSPITPAAHR